MSNSSLDISFPPNINKILVYYKYLFLNNLINQNNMIFYHLSQTLTLTRIYCTTLKLNTIDIGITLPKKFY
ncbi:hypothetical protein ADA01nite_42350 [Aneurinibacillus danicus]|uniref:Uncharacterized protein n=1 Tax=Aneurinibacillus danicus TaxID=267746 RepID=A0A511VD35_9BACL|nr:hypothetical protein ADA01nite_42350 [Aneurinibacillus danicus]